jgi:hypothetical protein
MAPGPAHPTGTDQVVQLVAARLVRNDTRHRTAAFGNDHFLTGLHVCEEFAKGRLEGGNVSDNHVTIMVIGSIPVKWVRGSNAADPHPRDASRSWHVQRATDLTGQHVRDFWVAGNSLDVPGPGVTPEFMFLALPFEEATVPP